MLYIILFVVIAAFFSYSKGWIGASFDSIGAKEAHAMLKDTQDVVLLDVRTQEEYNEGHIEGATLIPLAKLEQNLLTLESQKSKKIIVYCRSGSRSVSASRILSDNGFIPINMRGGINDWQSEGLALIK